MKTIFLLGATCTGKSEMAIDLAIFLKEKGFKTSIVNCDSKQVYKHINIGTGKVEGLTDKNGVYIYKQIEHFLIDYIDPIKIKTLYTLYDYKEVFNNLLPSLANKADYVIIVGGTGFYAKALYDDSFFNEKIKKSFIQNHSNFKENLEQVSLSTLQKFILIYQSYKKVNINSSDFKNLKRLQSKVLNLISKDFGWNETVLKKPIIDGKKYLFHLKRNNIGLKNNIEKKVLERIQKGLVSEVQKLLKNGVKESFFVKIGLDYRLTIFYLKGFLTKDEWVKKMILENIKYSKRQLVWFKKEPLIEVKTLDDILKNMNLF